MKCYLTVDFGSTFTKVTAIDAEASKVIATAKAFTTINTDIRDGLKTALDNLYASTGRIDFTEKMAASSAGGGLKMVAVGLVPSLTAKAAHMAACSAGAKVIKTYSYELSDIEQQEIFDIDPDIILLSGGTDGGNKDVIIHNAHKLACIDKNFSIIAAGNKSAASDVANILRASGKHTIVCGNVMPTFNVLDIMPAKNAIRGVFMERIIEAKGLSEAAKMMTAPIIPTPLAVFDGAELLSRGTHGNGIGSLLAVDVGGATTDVYTMCEGTPSKPGVLLKGLPEPYAKRTVEGDLGLRYSMNSLIESVTPYRAAGQLGIETDELVRHQHLCTGDPSYIPDMHSANKSIDDGLCGFAVEIAVERHCGRLESAFTPFGETFIQTGKDLSEVSYVIGIGGPVINSREPRAILHMSLQSPEKYDYLKPVKPHFLLDKKYIFAAMGLISRKDKELAMKIMLDEITKI